MTREMTKEEAIEILNRDDDSMRKGYFCINDFIAIEVLKSEKPCGDAISRQAAINAMAKIEQDDIDKYGCAIPEGFNSDPAIEALNGLPSITTQPKTGLCKDCKYFEYDSVAKVNGIPLIVAHEICSRWGDGCKTREDGYCFLFEPQESEGEK